MDVASYTAPNFLHTPEDGWSLVLCADRPHVEEFKVYQMPASDAWTNGIVESLGGAGTVMF